MASLSFAGLVFLAINTDVYKIRGLIVTYLSREYIGRMLHTVPALALESRGRFHSHYPN